MAKHKVFHLTARQDFGPYKKGDHIEDEAEVERILNGEHRVHVIRVLADKEDEKAGTSSEPPPIPPVSQTSAAAAALGAKS